MLAIRDCADDGKLQGTYSHHALARALKEMPSDGGEYTDCANAVRKALTGGSGSTVAPPPNGVVTASGAVAASADDAARLQTVVEAADRDVSPPPVATAATPRAAANVDTALADLGQSAAPAYRPDVPLLVTVLSAGSLMLGAAAAMRARQRA